MCFLWKATKEYLNPRATKFRVFRVLFRAPSLPSLIPHFSPPLFDSRKTPIGKPLAIYRGLSGPLGPKPRKSQKKVSGASGPRPPRESGKSLEKVSRVWKKSRKGPEKTFSRLCPDSWGGPGPEALGDFFQIFWVGGPTLEEPKGHPPKGHREEMKI